MSLLRIGNVMCETDDTHTFDPKRVYPPEHTSFVVVADSAQPRDLTPQLIDGRTSAIFFDGCPKTDQWCAADPSARDFDCIPPPQLMVLSTDPKAYALRAAAPCVIDSLLSRIGSLEHKIHKTALKATARARIALNNEQLWQDAGREPVHKWSDNVFIQRMLTLNPEILAGSRRKTKKKKAAKPKRAAPTVDPQTADRAKLFDPEGLTPEQRSLRDLASCLAEDFESRALSRRDTVFFAAVKAQVQCLHNVIPLPRPSGRNPRAATVVAPRQVLPSTVRKTRNPKRARDRYHYYSREYAVHVAPPLDVAPTDTDYYESDDDDESEEDKEDAGPTQPAAVHPDTADRIDTLELLRLLIPKAAHQKMLRAWRSLSAKKRVALRSALDQRTKVTTDAVVQSLLQTFVKKVMSHEASASEQESAAWYHWPFYTWVGPLLTRGSEAMTAEVALEEKDLYHLPSFETPEVVSARLQEAWNDELERDDPSLARALRRAFWSRIAVGGCFRLLSDGAAFAAPFLLRLLIDWLNDDTEAEWIGWVLVVALVLSNVVMSAALVNATHHTTTGFQQMATASAVMTYNAAFEFNDGHGKTGPLIAAHSSDAFKLLELAMFIHGVWVSPLLVLGAVVALYFFIGAAGFIAVGLLILSIPLQSFLMGLVYTFRGAQVKLMDVRVQKINEALQGIRICKFMNWELSFSRVIGSSREAEVVVLGKTYMARALANIVMNALQQVVLLALFALTYVIDEDNITTAKVFPALSMINVIRIPLFFIPLSISKILETKISVERIQKILLERSHVPYVSKLDSKTHAITLDNVSVLGDNDQVLIDNANVRIPKKKLTIVTGATASGKSLLVKAMLGEVPVAPGSAVAREGDVAYVPQDPWVMNATLKENILLGGSVDDDRYLDTLNACQLMDDLEQLPGSDQTDIGERGINLSGGQKQRIALARAVYNTQPVVLMDDPLSAVDPHVCKSLFDDAICGSSLGKRTRVLVTHQTQFLPAADHIVFMKDCTVVFQGTYKEYLKFLASIGEKAPHDDHGPHSPTDAAPMKKPARREIPAPQQDDALMSAEVNRVGDVQWATYLWWATLGGLPKMALTMIMSALWTTGVVFFNLLLAYWAGGESLFGRDPDGPQYILWLSVCVFFIVVSLAARQFCHAFFSVQAAKNSHAAMMGNILRAPISFFDTTPLGRIMNRFTKDIDAMDTRIQEIVVMTLNIGFQLLGTIALVGIATVYLLPIFPVLGVIFYFLYKYYTQTLRGVKRIEGSARSPMIAMMNGCVNGLASIRGYNMVDQFIEEHMRRTRRAMTPSYCVRCCQRWLSMRTESLGSFVVLCTGLFAVVVKVTDGQSWAVGFTPSVSALAITYALATTNAVTFLTRTMADLESEMSSAERVKEYADAIPQERDVEYSSEPGETPPPDAAWPKDGTLSFCDVQLRYRDGLPLVLKGVTFDVPTGSKVGIVGRTGSGKSTLLLALFRMVELAGGSIRFSGKDINELSLTDLRQQITIIPQDPLLFEGTIRSNLDPFDELSDADVWAAVDRVGMRDRLTDFITTGPDGLDAPVAEKGGNFSVGQRQLLCLARALLKRSKVLLLDEATASVDFESDALIQRTIRTEFATCTVLTIAHRLATVADSDRMLVLGAGSVVEYGAPRELLQTKGSQFRQMAEQLGEKQFANIMRLSK